MIKRIKNRAFTLIELLAVIVILAVILTIAIPRVLNVIEESDKESFRLTGESLIRGAKDRLVYDMEETVEGKTYTIEDGFDINKAIYSNVYNENNIGELEKDEDYQLIKEILNERIEKGKSLKFPKINRNW